MLIEADQVRFAVNEIYDSRAQTLLRGHAETYAAYQRQVGVLDGLTMALGAIEDLMHPRPSKRAGDDESQDEETTSGK